MSSPLTLIAADIGNVNTKYRRQGGAWEIEPSLVRLFSTRTGYAFTSDTPVQPFVYVSGPAGIEANVPYLIGRDAQRAGVSDVASSAAQSFVFTRQPTCCSTSTRSSPVCRQARPRLISPSPAGCR